jgi:hypothetical protein
MALDTITLTETIEAISQSPHFLKRSHLGERRPISIFVLNDLTPEPDRTEHHARWCKPSVIDSLSPLHHRVVAGINPILESMDSILAANIACHQLTGNPLMFPIE